MKIKKVNNLSKLSQNRFPKKKWEDKLFIIIISFIILFRIFIFDLYHIPSSSMNPTLITGDNVIVSKFAYGYSYRSFPFSIPLFKGRIFADKPERGDIIVYDGKKEPDWQFYPSTKFIKRVVGLPGDSVQMKDGILYINGKEVERSFNGYYKKGNKIGMKFIEDIGIKHEIVDLEITHPLDNTELYMVPKDHYFCLGDNRDNSADSRVVGAIPMERILGKAEKVLFSSKIKLWNPLTWFNSEFKKDRFFKNVYHLDMFEKSNSELESENS